MAKCYLAQGRASHFILDVLQLDVPNLFRAESEGSTSTLQSDILSISVPDQFTHFLSDYVKRNALQESLLSSVETIWVGVCVCVCVWVWVCVSRSVIRHLLFGTSNRWLSSMEGECFDCQIHSHMIAFICSHTDLSHCLTCILSLQESIVEQSEFQQLVLMVIQQVSEAPTIAIKVIPCKVP